jgi:hypothetical protein
MSYFPDLTPWSCFGHDRLIAVGWLEGGKPFPTGSVDPALVAKLRALFVDAWQPVHSLGPYKCTLCSRWKLFGRPVSQRKLFVPGTGFLYVAPDLILHYIEAHQYAPPAEFLEAVRACPEMNSPAYQAAARENGPHGFSYGKP